MVYLNKRRKKRFLRTYSLKFHHLESTCNTNTIAYKYVLYVYVSCASSRWNWPNRNIVQQQVKCKNHFRLKYCFVVWSLSRSFEIVSWSSLSSLISYKHACLRLWYNVNWTLFFFISCLFSLLVVLIWCILSSAAITFACFIAPGPLKGCVMFKYTGHLLWKAPVENISDCHSLKP